MPQSFAHISDPHLTTLDSARVRQLLNKRLLGYISWRRKRSAEHQQRVLQALQEDLQDAGSKHLVITGDLTQIGLPQEFEEAALWLSDLGKPADIALVPGNHDACVKVPWADGVGQWQAYMESDSATAEVFPSLRVRDGIAFIGLSSACPTLPLMASGTLGAAQLSQLPQMLDDAAAKGLFRVVFLHHPPLPGIEKWRKRLTDAPALQDILVQHGAELVLHGHGHRAQQHQLQTNAGNVLVIAVPSASALGLHGRDIAAYNRYHLTASANGWNLEIQGRRYNAQHQSFETLPSQQVEILRKVPQQRNLSGET
jgi:3',5'-cyclic AMP phosphodiesterase CpdA